MKEKKTKTKAKEFPFEDDVTSPSPRGVFEVPISGTDSDSTGSSNYSACSPVKYSPAMLPPPGKEGYGQQWRAMIDGLRFKSVRRFSTIPLLAASYEISRRSLRKKLARNRASNEDDDDDDDCVDLEGIPTKPSWRNFGYDDLAAATDDFSSGKNKHQTLFFFFSLISG